MTCSFMLFSSGFSLVSLYQDTAREGWGVGGGGGGGNERLCAVCNNGTLFMIGKISVSCWARTWNPYFGIWVAAGLLIKWSPVHILPIINRAPLLTAFHYHPPIIVL